MHTCTWAHRDRHTYTHITSSLLARAACWVTVNAVHFWSIFFCAFLIYFLCNDKVEMSLLLRTLFFKQKGERRGATLQRQKNALVSQLYDYSQSSSRLMLSTFVTQQNPQEVILSACWVFSINPMNLFFASTDDFSLRHCMWMLSSDRSASLLHWTVHFSLSLDCPSLRTFDLMYFRSLLTLGRRAKGEIMP